MDRRIVNIADEPMPNVILCDAPLLAFSDTRVTHRP